jgi:hypothetical protein
VFAIGLDYDIKGASCSTIFLPKVKIVAAASDSQKRGFG